MSAPNGNGAVSRGGKLVVPCSSCARSDVWMHSAAPPLCKACYRREHWRPQGGPAVERDRAHSRAWKREHRDAVRAYERAYGTRPDRPRCKECDSPMGTGRRNYEGDGVCARCIKATQLRRRAQIERMWNDGATLQQIADALGTTSNTVGVEVARMREAGYRLPYRHRRARPAHPEQVAP